MLLNQQEQDNLLSWAKRHVYASNSFVSFVARFNDKICIDLGFHTILDCIKVRVNRKGSWLSRFVFGPYDWKTVLFTDDGPWWDDIRRSLPKLIEQDRIYDLERQNKRRLELNNMAVEYNK